MKTIVLGLIPLLMLTACGGSDSSISTSSSNIETEVAVDSNGTDDSADTSDSDNIVEADGTTDSGSGDSSDNSEDPDSTSEDTSDPDNVQETSSTAGSGSTSENTDDSVNTEDSDNAEGTGGTADSGNTSENGDDSGNTADSGNTSENSDDSGNTEDSDSIEETGDTTESGNTSENTDDSGNTEDSDNAEGTGETTDSGNTSEITDDSDNTTSSDDTIDPDSTNDSNTSTESSVKEMVWSNWSNSANTDTQFTVSEMSEGLSGFATLDGGDFTPTQSTTVGVIETGGNGDTNFIGQSNNESYYIDFEITVDDTYTELSSFSFDAYTNNQGDPQLNWTLSVEPTNLTAENVLEDGTFPYSEITIGTVERQAMSATADEWQTLSFDLTSLSDYDAGANGTVRFRLYAWGGTSDNEVDNVTGIDNVIISMTKPDTIEAERPGLGERADWLRGVWGINWKPAYFYNGYIELVTIDDFMEQIADLSSLSYIQLHLNSSNIYSPVHAAPNDILESLWGEQAVDDDSFTTGDTTNLIVPRAVSGIDPFGDWLEAVKGAGLKTQIYLNASNMLYRSLADTGSDSNPDEFPDITERWYAYCDSSKAVQAFLDSKPYYRSDDYPNREYMFCYAEFILRDYAKTYGHSIDAWLFDSGRYLYDGAGDDQNSGILAQQRLYQAFTEAVRAGDRDVAVAFNNSTGNTLEIWSPFHRVTLFDDYTFGHPFNGGKYIGGEPDTDDYGPGEDGYDVDRHYDQNYRMMEFINATQGNVLDLDETLDYFGIAFRDFFDWDDKVVGHVDPPMATSNWNTGDVAALTDEHFTLWNTTAISGGGAISWGGPLVSRRATSANRDFTLSSWAIEQLTVMDASLAALESAE